MAELAKEAEQVGWDGFFIWDHILFDDLDRRVMIRRLRRHGWLHTMRLVSPGGSKASAPSIMALIG